MWEGVWNCRPLDSSTGKGRRFVNEYGVFLVGYCGFLVGFGGYIKGRFPALKAFARGFM